MNDTEWIMWIEYWIIWFGLVSPWVLIGIYSIYSLKRILWKENKE